MDEKALHRRVAELEDECAYLKSELGLSIRATQVRALVDLGMGAHHARVILALRAAKGRTLSVFQIGDAADLTPLSAKIITCQARKWAPGIENRRADQGLGGYHLNREGQAFVDDILRQCAALCEGPATASLE